MDVDSAGNLFVTDNGHNRIRRIDAITGIITTIAGNGIQGYSGDGYSALNATMNFPYGISVDKLRNIFFTDAYNHAVRKIDTNGIISTIAGTGVGGFNGDNMLATSAQINTPTGVITNDEGTVFIADIYNHRIRKIGLNGIIHTIAGNGTLGFSGDGGSSVLSQLNYPANMCFDFEGNMLVCDLNNHVIRKVGTIDTPASTNINLSLYLEGFYIGNGLMAPVLMNQGIGNDIELCDSIMVELHESVAPYGTVANAKSLLYTNGNAVASFPLLSGLYYVVIKQRNCIETWSALPLSLIPCTTCPFQEYKDIYTYGSNVSEVESGMWALYSGDINGDNNVDLLDSGNAETDINNFAFGYYPSDINGDGNVDLLDIPDMEANINAFVFSSHP